MIEFQYQFNGLSNAGITYTFTVVAGNAVGVSDGSNTASAKPSQDNSAIVITSGGTQQTGTGTVTSSSDKQIEQQQFPTGFSGLGTITECVTGTCSGTTGLAAAFGGAATTCASGNICASNFCNGSQCIGVPTITKLLEANVPSGSPRYLVTFYYNKSIIPNTSVTHHLYFLANPTAGGTGSQVPDCPKKGNLPAGPCVTKLVNQPAGNPALVIQASVPKTLTDPGWGAK